MNDCELFLKSNDAWGEGVKEKSLTHSLPTPTQHKRKPKTFYTLISRKGKEKKYKTSHRQPWIPSSALDHPPLSIS